MFKKHFLNSAIALLSVFTVGATHASLVGDSVTGSITNYHGWGVIGTQLNPTAVVGSGVEFNGQWKFVPPDSNYPGWDVAIDLSATSLKVTINDVTGSGNLYAYSNPLFKIDLGSLDLGSAITGVNLTYGIGQFTTGFDNQVRDVVSSAFTADSIALTWNNLPTATISSPYEKGVWTFDILTSNPTDVPEPGTLALMGLGLLALKVGRTKARKSV